MNAIHTYLKDVASTLQSGEASEHSYRPALKTLLDTLYQTERKKLKPIVNEPKKHAYGAPDFRLRNTNDISVGIIEAKDLHIHLDDFELHGKNKDQFKRYAEAEPNLILTNNLEFRFFREGVRINTVTVATLGKKGLTLIPEAYDALLAQLLDFADFHGLSIDSPTALARMMAKKARLIADVFLAALLDTPESTLKDQYASFKANLIPDLNPEQFADMYAQTIAYGMFSARLNDKTENDFTRREAQSLIPKSNPFLRHIYGHVAGLEMDERVEWAVDGLCEIFSSASVRELLVDFGAFDEFAKSGKEDPFIHFYETFLAEYDPALRKSRGVWFTPEPVVRYMVRAVDDILQSHFGLADGLADTSKITLSFKGDKNSVQSKEVHRVQVLDVATGTGTFLAQVVRQVQTSFAGQAGFWSDYVEKDLIPRLHGFELLMASYTVCHTKLDMLLKQSGYVPSSKNAPRLNVFLTNSLEEHHPDTHTIFAEFLGNEAKAANAVKRDSPIMVAMGNPPYSGESQNQGAWITGLMEDYKKEPGGREKLKEKNSKWINDDYVKFIRMGQHFVEKNDHGILAYITNHGYLDNPTFRGMRWQLLNAFDEIYIIDLHGNSLKKETTPEGGKDENVFDIRPGVAILILVKTGKKKKGTLATVNHCDLFGKRQVKYDVLNTHTLKTTPFNVLPCEAPMHYWVQRDDSKAAKYEKGFALSDLFPVNSVGIVTARDGFTIHPTKQSVQDTIERFMSLGDEAARKEFNLGKDVRDWQVRFAREDLKNNHPDPGQYLPIAYRPFDTRWTFYTGNSKGFHCYPRHEVMQHFIGTKNLGLVIGRQGSVVGDMPWNLAYITESIYDFNAFYRGGGVVHPLYLYPEKSLLEEGQTRTPNLETKILASICKKIKLTFVPEKKKGKDSFAPVDLLDYIYGVLHSPKYREQYQAFLKTDFPRVPYPTNADNFWQWVDVGAQLRALHLLQSPKLDKLITQYPVGGSNRVDRIQIEEVANDCVRVFINDTQYFDKVPISAWQFYIGGYQPLQKWLKDRKGLVLSRDDSLHWQRVVVSLFETHRLMQATTQAPYAL